MLCIVGCLAASPASIHQMPVAPLSHLGQPKMSLNIVKCPLVGKAASGWDPLGQAILSFSGAILEITSPETATSNPNQDQSNSVCSQYCCCVLDLRTVKKTNKNPFLCWKKYTHICLHKQKPFLKGHTETVHSKCCRAGGLGTWMGGRFIISLFLLFSFTMCLLVFNNKTFKMCLCGEDDYRGKCRRIHSTDPWATRFDTFYWWTIAKYQLYVRYWWV